MNTPVRHRKFGLAAGGCLLGVLFLCGGGPQWLLGHADRTTPWPPGQPTTSTQPGTSGPLRVLTFNVLCRVCDKEGYEPWDDRVAALRDVLERHDADLVGLQEFVGQDDLAEIIGPTSPYRVVSYSLGPWVYADAALLVRDSRFEVIDSGQLWLSPHPDRPLSAGWKRLSLPRYAGWAHLRQRSDGFELLFVNAHFDNNGPNKDGAAALFHQVFGSTERSLPVVVSGDFNTHRKADRYPTLLAGGALNNTQDLAEAIGLMGFPDPGARYFDTATLVDHVLVSEGVTVHSWTQDSPRFGENGHRPSDHPVIVVELELSR